MQHNHKIITAEEWKQAKREHLINVASETCLYLALTFAVACLFFSY